MVWKKDLAKLKQELKSEEDTSPKRPVPKPLPKPAVPQELEDEDALFLAAMGKRRKAASQEEALAPVEPEPVAAKPAPEKVDFKEAMASMKGVKPVQASKVPVPAKATASSLSTPPLPSSDLPPAPEPPLPAVQAAEEPVAPPAEPSPARSMPAIIQLAAGMAIEVDGTLDLRGHSPVDAMGRLKERLLDGHLLGWRTLHVQLGSSEELKEALMDFLAGPEAEQVTRYAQAPIPMGGAHAWILYLGVQGSSIHQERN